MAIDIKKAEALYGARYIGLYDIPNKRRDGTAFIREHVEVFYQPNPKVELGHTHYFGLITRHDYTGMLTGELWICNAAGILDAKYNAHRFEDGTIICSRFRHDYVARDGVMLDGGIDYCRSGGLGPNGYIHIVDDHEEFVPYDVAATNWNPNDPF